MKRKWGVINDILGRKKKAGVIHSIYVDGVLTNDKEKIANGFNTFFADIPKAFHDKLPQVDHDPHIDHVKRLKKCTSYLKDNPDSLFAPKKTS